MNESGAELTLASASPFSFKHVLTIIGRRRWVIIGTFIPIFAARLGYNEFVIGLALTANALMTAISLPIVGGLSDRIGRFKPIVIGLLVSVELTVAPAF